MGGRDRGPVNMPRAAAVALLLAACGDDGATRAPGSLGQLAFSEKDSGALVVLDVETGARSEITPALGAPGAIAFSPEGDHVAFAVEPIDGDRHVFVGDVATGGHHEVSPFTGNYGAGFFWGHGGWFTFMSWIGSGTEELRLATTSSAESRVIVEGSRSVLPSPTEAAYVVSRCTGPAVTPEEGCPSELVFEDVAGDRRIVLTTGFAFWPVAFIDQGRSVVGYERYEGATHLTVWELAAGGRVVDLGVYNMWLEISRGRLGVSSVSPGDVEVLTTDGTDVLAVRLDGGGQRVVSMGIPDSAGFTGAGDVLLESHINLTPGSDTPEYAYALHLSRAGVVTSLLEDARGCWNDARVSASGLFATWPCDEGTIVFSLADGSRVATHPQGDVLGFTPDDGAILLLPLGPIDEYSIEFRSHAGGARTLGHPAYQRTERGNVEWPPASYSPATAVR